MDLQFWMFFGLKIGVDLYADRLIRGNIQYLMNNDIGKFTYLLATKSCYLLQSATATK